MEKILINSIKNTIQDINAYNLNCKKQLATLTRVLDILVSGGIISNGDIAEVTSIINDINGAVSDIVYNEM